MSVVFITIPGADKISFAKELNEKTNGLDLVIVHKRRYKSLLERVLLHFKNSGFFGALENMFFGLLLRIQPELRARLQYFNGNPTAEIDTWPVESFYTDSVNSEEVYKRLEKIKPKVLVVWGAGLLTERIFNLAENAINLHMGNVQHYKGAIGNLQAVLDDEIEKIGATIHYIDKNADTGDVIKILDANTAQGPQNCLLNLHREAKNELLRVTKELLGDRPVTRKKQETSNSKIHYLKDWTPKKRYSVAKKLIDWEKGSN